MDKAELDVVLVGMRDFVARRVVEGFDDADTIIRSAVEVSEADLEPAELEAHAERLTTALIEEHLREQSQWVGPTDCDRLDRAFEELEGEGIVARHNCTCGQNCGHSEIWGEIAAVREEGGHEVQGYTFYHMQDTEGACEGGFLYLAYSAVSGNNEDTVQVGQRIVRALERAGLEVVWDGSAAQRIGVRLQWRRRR
jgi:hypothetical protein